MARKKSETWYVYRFINKTKKEIYHGVSKEPRKRVDARTTVKVVR